MNDKNDWSTIAACLSYFALQSIFGSAIAWQIMGGIFTLFVLYSLWKIARKMRKLLRDTPMADDFFISRKSDIYLYFSAQILIIAGIYLLFIGLTLLNWPLNWITMDTGVVFLIVSCLIEFYTSGKSDILIWKEEV